MEPEKFLVDRWIVRQTGIVEYPNVCQIIADDSGQIFQGTSCNLFENIHLKELITFSRTNKRTKMNGNLLSASNALSVFIAITLVGISARLLSFKYSSTSDVDAANANGICVKQLLQKYSVSRDFMKPISTK